MDFKPVLNWGRKHPIWSLIIVMLVVGWIGSIFDDTPSEEFRQNAEQLQNQSTKNSQIEVNQAADKSDVEEVKESIGNVENLPTKDQIKRAVAEGLDHYGSFSKRTKEIRVISQFGSPDDIATNDSFGVEVRYLLRSLNNAEDDEFDAGMSYIRKVWTEIKNERILQSPKNQESLRRGRKDTLGETIYLL